MQLSFRDCRHGVKRRRFHLALVLLAHAINDGNGVLLPADRREVELVVKDMLADGLVEEIRVDGDVRYGLRVTQRGLRFVGYPPLAASA